MRFKYENLFYRISFDGAILKYTWKLLLCLLLLNPFGNKYLEFFTRDFEM